jgi:hypothetical protein
MGVENISLNAEATITLGGSCSVPLDFLSPKGGISSSGVGSRVLLRKRGHRACRYGLRVQHRVRRRREAARAKVMGRMIVVRMIVNFRLSGDWLVDAIAIFVGILGAVVEGIGGHCEETVATISEDDDAVVLGFATEDGAMVE